MRQLVAALALGVVLMACGATPDTDAGIPDPSTSQRDTNASTYPVDPTETSLPPGSTAAPGNDPDTTAADAGDATTDAAFDLGDALIVSGTIDIATVEVTRIHAQTLPSRYVDFTDTVAGICQLELFDNSGSLLDAAGFTPEPDSEMESALFTLSFPLPEVGVHRAVVSCEGKEIGSVDTGPSAPTVSITTPRAGDTFIAETDSVAWIGSDADGDDLTYTLLYSTDNGTSWQPLTAAAPNTEMSFGEMPLQGSDEARFLVIASDGLNSGHAVSDVFTLRSDAPAFAFNITDPISGQTFVGRQLVVLAAGVVPYAGADIDDLTMEWSSDLDGPLGTIEVGDGGTEYRLDLLATDLSEGAHILTATVSDGNGVVVSETVAIEIRRNVPAPS